jgi:hypothetical protein
MSDHLTLLGSGLILERGHERGYGMNRVLSACVAAVWLAGACASSEPAGGGGARPPQGAGPAGTDFGFWNRDAEGAVDAAFRTFISGRYRQGDEALARPALERDGFTCQDGNRPDAQPVPVLECTRLYRLNDDVHAWSVRFWADESGPKARYTRTHRRDPYRNYDDKKKRG